MKNFWKFVLPVILACLPACRQSSGIVTVKNGRFDLDGKSQYYIGANFWYGAILASDGRGGDKARLAKELDSLKALGVTNLRVLVGGDGPDGVSTRIEPTLQKEPGVYNDTIFLGLDNLLAEMGKRDMKAVLYLNNAWEWSGGFGLYLEWAGAGKALIPAVDGYWPFMQQMAGYSVNPKAQELFENHIRNVVTRTNSVTGLPYSEDPAIFSWQICNEPRCFSSDPENQRQFAEWIWRAAALIKSLDPNHMVSTGSEGSFGCEQDMDLYEKVHSCPDIDYLTMHIWPYNWEWVSADGPQWGIDNAEAKTAEYIADHVAMAEKLGKPLVLEEFGFPRDDFSFAKGTPTTGRDRYYHFVFGKVIENARNNGPFEGVNFWGWGGYSNPVHENWQRWDDFTGDPAQEAQGLNSVFADDRGTVKIIREAASSLAAPAFAYSEPVDNWIFDSEDQKPLKVVVKSQNGFSDKIPVGVTVKTDMGEDYGTFEKVADLRDGCDTLYYDLGLIPGFYRVSLVLEGQVPEDNSFNIGCSPELISSPQDKQPDFDAFWQENLSQLGLIHLGTTLERIPGHSNDVRTTYRAEMYSYGERRISGILVVPVKEGTFPARITYMGYNSDPWYPDPSADPEVVDFILSVRDQGLDKTPGQGWVRQGLESKDTYYYKGAFLDCVRAVDLVSSLPKVDNNRIIAEGGSQGGAFTLVAAALDPRIKAIAPFVPFLSDFPDYFKVAQWPANEILPEAERLGIPEEELYKTLSYFDVKNFTDRIHCPVLMGFGLQDPVCPPHTNFAGFNQISSRKEWICFPYAGHHVEEDPAWWEARNRFFNEFI